MNTTNAAWSVVIPTIWASGRITSLIASLELCENVAEVVLIDNRPEARLKLPFYSKLRIVPQQANIFVNPAWNLGVTESRFPLVCICNDDVSFDTSVYCELERFLQSRQIGVVVGCHRDCFSSPPQEIQVEQGHDLGFGWGCVMFCRRESYPQIPAALRIWSGDRYIIAKAKSVFAARFAITTEMSVSSGQSVFDDVKYLDKVHIQRMLSRWEKYAVKASARRNGGSKTPIAVVRAFLKCQLQKICWPANRG